MPTDDEQKQGATPTLEQLQEQLQTALDDAEKWKGLSRKHETRATENADKAKRLDEIEESSKTELQKLAEERDSLAKRIADRDAAEASSKLVGEIAKDKGVPESALRGSTREELEQHADELKALLPKAAPSADGQGDQGDQIGEGDMSATDVVDAATK